MTHLTKHTLKHRIPATAAALVLVSTPLLAGCGGDDDIADAIKNADEPTTQVTDAGTSGDTSASDDAGSADNSMELKPVSFALPEPSGAPDGFRRLQADCAPDDPWFTYAVPETWELTGTGYGGSGSPLSDSVDQTFSTDIGDVKIETDPDSVRPDGTILDNSGQPFQSFDYDYTRGDETKRITFEEVGTVSVGDQDVEVMVADQAQAPDFLSSTEYKARVQLAMLPNPAPGDDDKLQPASMLMTVTHDAEDGDLPTDTVEQMVGSFAMPSCTKDMIVARLEVRFGQDVDGDGQVASPEDLFPS